MVDPTAGGLQSMRPEVGTGCSGGACAKKSCGPQLFPGEDPKGVPEVPLGAPSRPPFVPESDAIEDELDEFAAAGGTLELLCGYCRLRGRSCSGREIGFISCGAAAGLIEVFG